MSARRPTADTDERLTPDEIGRQLIVARDAGLRWKMLVRRYGLSRSRLVQIHRQARRQGGAEKETVCPRCGQACRPG